MRAAARHHFASLLRYPVPLLLAALAVTPARAAEIDHAEEYAACMALVEEDAEEAFETALAWESMGGGNAARHCAAVALIGLDARSGASLKRRQRTRIPSKPAQM